MNQLVSCMYRARGAVLVAVCLSSCTEEPPPELLPMSLRVEEVSELDAGRYRLTLEISNFEPGLIFHGTVSLSGHSEPLPPITLMGIAQSRFEIETPPLDRLRPYLASISLESFTRIPTRRLSVDHSWKTAPPEITMVTSVSGDARILEVTGAGLRSLPHLWLAVVSEPGATPVRKNLLSIEGDDTHRTGVVPVLLATPPSDPRRFTGAVPSLEVHLSRDHSEAMADIVVGTVQLKYTASPPVPAMGLPGSEFELKLFHPARAPDLLGLTVRFDDVALAPISVVEREDLSTGGIIYLTRSRFRVPANATPGAHQITVVSSHGEEFLNSNPTFTVTTAAL